MAIASVSIIDGDEHRRQDLVNVLKYLEYQHVSVVDWTADWREVQAVHNPALRRIAVAHPSGAVDGGEAYPD